MACNGICDRHKPFNPPRMGSRYKLGYKRCTVCDIFLEVEGYRCPCCHTILRTHYRQSEYKRRYDNVKM